MLASQRREEILVGSDVAERINRVGGKVQYNGDNGDVDIGDIDDNNGQVLICCCQDQKGGTTRSRIF